MIFLSIRVDSFIRVIRVPEIPWWTVTIFLLGVQYWSATCMPNHHWEMGALSVYRQKSYIPGICWGSLSGRGLWTENGHQCSIYEHPRKWPKLTRNSSQGSGKITDNRKLKGIITKNWREWKGKLFKFLQFIVKREESYNSFQGSGILSFLILHLNGKSNGEPEVGKQNY